MSRPLVQSEEGPRQKRVVLFGRTGRQMLAKSRKTHATPELPPKAGG